MNSNIQNKFNDLESARKKLLAQLDALPSEKLAQQPEPSKWSITQIMAHLYTAEAGCVSYVKKKMQYKHTVTNAGIGAKMRITALKLGLKLPIKYKVPPQVSQVPNVISFADAKANWSQARNSLRQLLEDLPEEFLYKETFKHPVAGKMNIFHMMEFLQTHFDHHLIQFDRTKQKVLK